MNISLPAPLKAWVEQQVIENGYSTASEYVREMIRRERQRRRLRQDVDARLTDAIESGESTPMTRRDWSHIRSEGIKRARRRSTT